MDGEGDTQVQEMDSVSIAHINNTKLYGILIKFHLHALFVVQIIFFVRGKFFEVRKCGLRKFSENDVDYLYFNISRKGKHARCQTILYKHKSL